MLAAAVSEDAAQDGNVLIEIVLFDDGVRPDRFHQLVFADGFSAVLHQVEQGVKHLGRQWHWRAVACQRALTGVNVERAELVDLVRRMGHGVSYVLRNIQETPKTSLVALDILYELGSHCSFLKGPNMRHFRVQSRSAWHWPILEMLTLPGSVQAETPRLLGGNK